MTGNRNTNLGAILFAKCLADLHAMDRDDRVRACYLHACLKYVNREYLTNTSVRERFGIEQKNMAKASRLIREAINEGAISAYNPDAAPKMMKYVPWWASAERRGVAAT